MFENQQTAAAAAAAAGLQVNAPRVLIVGGGPGGLALAQGLHRLGLPVRLVERERWRSDVVYGFRLRLRRRGVEALRTLLPPALFGAFERTSGVAPAQSVLLDEQLRELPAPPALQDDDVLPAASVSRITLQQILLAGLGDVVEIGRSFTHYDERPDGRVCVWFDDGSNDVVDLLVGADGADSTVRRQLLPQARPVDSGALRIAGKLELTPLAQQRLPPWLHRKSVSVRGQAGWHLFVTAHRLRHRGLQPTDAAYTGNDAAQQHRAGLLFDNTRDYVFWALGVPRALRPDAATLARGAQALHAWAQRQAEAWPEDLRALLQLTDPATVNATPVLASLPVPAWPTAGVTLLGDALHGSTYFGATGANAALLDAQLLQQALLQVQQGQLPLRQAVAAYEEAMRHHGYAAVQASVDSLRRNIGGIGPLQDWPELHHEPRVARPAGAARVDDDALATGHDGDMARDLFFHDPQTLPLLEQIERVARSRATALILGETGTGKELVARHLHRRSGRVGPFVAVNCAALAESLIDAELFGHEAGAFTGAAAARAGWFEAAQGGTLFLDEIGDMPLALQVKLLRVLQEQQVVRVGARQPRAVDVRLVAATHVDLAAAVQAGRFRADLYYRLHVATLRLPPLRERRGDILPLARHFAETYRRRLDAAPLVFAAEAEAALRAHAWPGNIRELENLVHYAVIVCSDGRITREHLRLNAAAAPPGHPPQAALQQAVRALLLEGGAELHAQIERVVLETVFEHCRGNQLASARALGVSRNVLRAQLLRHGLIEGQPRQRGRAESGA